MRAAAPFILPILLFVGYGFGAMAIATGLRRHLDGWHIRSYVVIPGLIGFLIVAAQAVRNPEDSIQLVPHMLAGALVAGSWLGVDAAWSIPIGIGAFVVGVLAAEMLLVVLPAYVGRGWLRLRRAQPPARAATDAARLVLGLGTVAALLGVVTATSSLLAAEARGTLSVVATYDLPGTPTSVVSADDGSGFISFAEGSIARYALPATAEGDIEVTMVADGLTYPRGLAILDDELFAIDLGPLPCEVPYPGCGGVDPDGDADLLAHSRASVLKFSIHADGTLGSAATIVGDLPVSSTANAPGSISPGPDGFLYMTVGNIDDWLAPFPERLAAIDHPNLALLGTVIRFRPDGSQLSPILRGLRNVYELARDPEGRLYGVDNGGVGSRDYRGEEVQWLREGLDYGFPELGTFSRERDPETLPLTVLTTGGSAGLAWAGDVGMEPGLVVGSSGQIVFVPISSDDGGPYVDREHPIRTLIDGITGFVTSLEPLDDGRLLATVFGGYADLQNKLLILEAE